MCTQKWYSIFVSIAHSLSFIQKMGTFVNEKSRFRLNHDKFIIIITIIIETNTLEICE